VVTGALPTLASPYGANQNIQNEIRLLESPALMEEVVSTLDLETTFYWKGRFLDTELYKNSPIKIDSVTLSGDGYRQLYEVEVLNEQSFNFVTADSIYQFDFGEVARLPFGEFRVVADFEEFPPNRILVRFNTNEAMANYFVNRLSIRPEGGTNVLAATLKVPMPEKAVDVLNYLVEVYNRASIFDKNQKNANTLAFLNTRVYELSKELNSAEDNVLDFKIENQVTSIDALQIESILTKVEEQRKIISELELQLNVLLTLEEYIKSEQAEEGYAFLPTRVNIEKEQFQSLLQLYNEQLLKRDRLLFSATPDNPTIAVLNQELSVLKAQILEIVQSESDELARIVTDFKTDLAQLEQNINTLPQKERKLFDINRQKEIIEQLYLFLLQRKEEVIIRS
jgi:uncharacterized protein involved in exopolysaccharide biosynthesis